MPIKSYNSYSDSKTTSSRWMLLCMILIFFMTLTTFTIMEFKSFYAEEPSVVRIIMNSFKSSEEREFLETSSLPNKIVLVNVEQQQDTEELLKTIITKEELKAPQPERKAREAEAEEENTTERPKNSYYEEQSPVVVYSKSEPEIPLSYRQPVYVPPKQDSSEEKPYNDNNDEQEDDSEDNVESRQNPYYAASEEQGYYNNQDEESYYRPASPQRQPYYGYDDSREESSDPNSGREQQQQDSEEGRSSHQSNYDSYYRQWHYATPSPASANRRISPANGQENRKLQPMTAASSQNRDPYATYMDDYDYMPPHSGQNSHQLQQYHSPASSSQSLQKPAEQPEGMNLLSILKTLKTMWDLYQSFASSWNTMAQRHNKEEELAKQKYKQQMQLRVNATRTQQQQQQKQKQNNQKKNPQRTTKNPKKTTSTSTTPSTTTLGNEGIEMDNSSSTEEESQQVQTSKVEPRKGAKGDNTNTKDVEGLREKRQTSDNTELAATTDDVGEGRYIKGDPLKGYYDFVITEGSYKFWAVFQVGTALLIIYSTFAAIYYSKVNPLVSDYDYTDYLGGARSLSGGDLDFVDDETTGSEQNSVQQKSWSDWLPRTGHSLKFILDAIDKLPVDLDNMAATKLNENVNNDDDKEESKAM